MALQPGEIIEGKYRIVRQLGEGGMGAVYEGENTRIRRRVAIKVLHASVAEKTDAVQRFEREAQAAGRIGSEHIVEVLDLGSLPSGERYMVMEYLDGEDLTTRIKKRRRLRPQDSVPIIHQVLEGLIAAHDAGIVHRDLKPDNIFLLTSKAGRVDFVKVLDFGVSKFSTLDPDMGMTSAGSVMGTPYYMAPEQAKGGDIDGRTDLYAVGVVLYQMTTGRVPFNAGSFNELLFKIALETPEPVDKLVPDVSPSFAAIIRKAMAREPMQRFQSAREFQEALAQWQLQAPPIEAAVSHPDLPGMLQRPPLATASSSGRPSGMGLPTPMPSGDYVIPGTATPVPGSTPMLGMMTPAQAAFSVTQTRSRRRTTAVALVVVMVGIMGLGSVAAWLALTPGPARAAGPTDSAVGTTPPADAAPAETAEAAKPEGAATVEPTAEASAAPTEAPTAEPTAEPTAVAVTPRATPGGKPPVTKTKATSEPAATGSPAATTKAGGRQINTEL